MIIESSPEDMIITNYLHRYKCWEPYNTILIEEILRPGDSFIDIGAHVGYFSVLAAGCVGQSGNVLAFEPEPRNFDFLSSNIKKNNVEWVEAQRFGIGERAEDQWLFLSEHNHGGHQIEFVPVDSSVAPKKVTCNLIGLDEFIAQGHIDYPVNFIKVDVQGYEAKALFGMTQTILENSEHFVMLIEYSPSLLQNFDAEERGLAAFHEFLETYSYSIYIVDREVHDEDVNLHLITSNQLKKYIPQLLGQTEMQGLDECMDLLIVFSEEGQNFLINRISHD